MRVKIIGDTESARVLRGYLQKAGVAVSDHLPKFALSCTIHLSEHSGQNIICDSIDCPLEMHILRHITELTEKDVVLRRRTGVISTENEIHLSVPAGDPESAHAVEVGVLRGVQRAHFHRSWWRRVLPAIVLVSLLATTAWSSPRHATPQPELTAETSGGVIHISMPPGGIFPQFQTGGGTSPCSGATAPAHTFCGNNTGSVAAPAYVSLTAADLPASITSNTSGLAATATALASTPSTCGAGVAAIGVLANGNATGCFTPGGLANPMTTLGDIIYGASSGTPTRLGPNGTATNLFLRSVSGGVPTWNQVAYSDITPNGTAPGLNLLTEIPTQIAAPTNTTPTVANTGGALVNGSTLYFQLTLTNPNGETVPSAEGSILLSAGNGCLAASTTCSVTIPKPTYTDGSVTSWTVYDYSSSGGESKFNACANISAATCVVTANGSGSTPPAFNAATVATTTSVWRSNIYPPVISEIRYVDGNKYTSLAAAIKDAPNNGVVICPPGWVETYNSTIHITKPLHIVLDGCQLTTGANPLFSPESSQITIESPGNSAINLVGAGASAVRPLGTVDALTVEGLNIIGDANNTGTVTVTNGSTAVTGSGTNFPNDLAGGQLQVVTGGNTITLGTVLTVNSTTSLTMTANWSGPTATGTSNWTMVNNQQGIYNGSGQTLTNIRYLNNDIQNTTLCISANADPAGSVQDVLYQGNTCKNTFGTQPGQGYGFHFAGGQTQTVNGVTSFAPANVRMIGNTSINAQRHDYYWARGGNGLIAQNTSRGHRQNVSDGSDHPSIAISRMQDVQVADNVVTDSWDGCISVDTDSTNTIPAQNVTLSGGDCRNIRAFYPLAIGTTNPATDGIVTDVIVSGTRFYEDQTVTGTFGGAVVGLLSGKKISFVGMKTNVVNTSLTNTTVYIPGTGETAGTTTYNDQIYFIGNQFYGANSTGQLHGIELNTSAVGSAINLFVLNNLWGGPGNGWLLDNTLTDPNITVNNYATTGLTPLTLVKGLAGVSSPITLAPSSTSRASLSIQGGGVAPTTPVFGDHWCISPDCLFYDGTANQKIAAYTRAQTWTANQTQGANTAHIFAEGTSSGAAANVDACYGDSTDHTIECADNNGTFRPLRPLVLFVTSDFTTAANTNLQTITGLSWTVPARANKMNVACSLAYHQNTAAVADNWGIQAATNNPTNIFATYDAQTAATAYAGGVLATLATTTATNIGGTFTPSAITTDWTAKINALIENAASANTFNIMIKTSTAADALVVKRGSTCTVTFQ